MEKKLSAQSLSLDRSQATIETQATQISQMGLQLKNLQQENNDLRAQIRIASAEKAAAVAEARAETLEKCLIAQGNGPPSSARSQYGQQ